MPTDRRQRPLLEDIEPRILYAADTPGAPLATAGLAATEAQRVHQDAATAAAVAPRSELVFVDTRIEDHATLVASVQADASAEGRSVEVILIGEGQDGIALVTDTLAQRSDVAAVHLLGHGESGSMQLGTSTLDSDALLQRAPQIAAWGNALTQDADLLLYGCDLAADAEGRALAEGLAQLTGADVAASTDRTGAAALGGNWALEMQTGAIEAQLAFGLQTQAQWQGVLATYTVTNINDSGAGSLRQAITNANANGGTDTINFAITGTGVHTITLASALPGITGTVIIDATTDDSFAANSNRPAVEIDVNTLNSSNGLQLTSTAGGSTIRGLVIRNFTTAAIRIDAGSDGNTIAGNYLGAIDSSGNQTAAPVSSYVVYVAGANSVIGGSTAADRNVIGSGGSSTYNVFVTGPTATGNQITGNRIGMNAAGTASFTGAQRGVALFSGAAGNTIDGNVISGAGSQGIYQALGSGGGNVLRNNLIGLTAAGTGTLGTPADGIRLDAGNSTTIIGNRIAGTSQSGILLGSGVDGTVIQGNTIGTDAAGTATWGTGQSGIQLNGAINTRIGGTGAGEGNVIAFANTAAAGHDGITVASGSGNTILGNSIYGINGNAASGALGIDLGTSGVMANDAGDADTGANNLQNFPVLTLVKTDGSGQVSVSGTLNSSANSYFRIEVFASPSGNSSGYGEGKTYLGFVNVATDGSGNATFSTTLSAAVPVGNVISATATRSVAGYTTFTDTSEFAKNVSAISSTQATITVDTESDTIDGDTTSLSTLLANKGADGFISLREAITATNATPNGTGGADRIHFGIAGTGVHTITLTSALPSITGQVILDGSTDDSFAVNSSRPAIVLDGNNGAYNVLALNSGSGGSTIRGFVITNTQQRGILINPGSDGNTIAGNYIGKLNAAGTQAATTTGQWGVVVFSNNNIIGGTTAADRNVISGNGIYGVDIAFSAGNQVIGNYFGSDATGMTAIAIAQSAVFLDNGSTGNIIGGAGAAGNLFLGNEAVWIFGENSDGNTVQGNQIGLAADGTTVRGVSSNGIKISAGADNTVVGGVGALGNVILGVQGTGSAIYINGDVSGTVVQGNYVGTNRTRTITATNAFDIELDSAAHDNLIGGVNAGEGNYVTATTSAGVLLRTTAGAGNAVLGNLIWNTTKTGIDLQGGTESGTGATANDLGDADSGPNNLQNTPVLSLVKTNGSTQIDIRGSLNSTASSYFRLEFYAKPADGSSATYLGFANVATNGSGNASFSNTFAVAVPVGYTVTATATKSNAGYSAFTDTSEFSAALDAGTTPVNTVPGPKTLTEDVSGAISGLSVVNGGVAAMTTALSVLNGTLNVSLAGGATISSGANGSAALTLSGTTAQVNAALATLSYLGNANYYGSDTLTMLSTDASTLSDSDTVAITVTAVNEAPVITSNGAGATASVSIAESTTAVATVTASDVDGQVLVYSISGGADAALFQINSSTGVLSFVSARDFETPTDVGGNNVYDVTVRVSDGALTDTQAIAVTVTDVNDAPPVITSNGAGATASVSVAENGTAVTTVTATDADSPAPTFSISGGVDAALFQINSSTGVLSFLAARDFENPTDSGGNNIYDVTVRASDGTLTDTQAIAVTVTNVNDNAPVITSNGAGASASLNVAENNTAVTTVTATDADGSALTYSISGGTDAALFQINSSTGALSFVSAPNFESPTDAGANNVYNVTVRVSDGTFTDTQTLGVTVTDVNDLAPVISSNGGGATASVSIAENGAAVTTVTATDADGPALTFSISGGADAALFQIHASTGVLSFLAAPNFENPTDAGADNVYDVTVRASDGTLTDTQAIAVTVTNLNDNAPVITSNGAGASAAINVTENTTAVSTVTASDADGNTLTYSISGGADAALFQIDAATGVLSFIGAPNFESPTDAGGNNVYNLTVRASDGTLADTQNLAVTVTDANDNGPVITSNGGGATANVSIAENGAAVTTVTATDVDGPALTFSIVGGADAALFQIDAGTGVLSFLSAPNFESPTDAGANNIYDVTVRASDGTLTDTQAIAVTVTNVNDNAPVITSNGAGASAAINVAENTTAVGTVTASDADGNTLTYRISGGADAALFQIDASTGVLRFVGAPDFDSPTDAGGNNVYNLTVRASDGTLADTQDLAVTVTDVNDNAPVITSNGGGATASVSIAENSAAVTTVVASDADGSALTYSIVGGADAALFQINASTGALSFLAAPNFENPADAGGNNVYDVTVQVSDGSLADTQAIAVTVTNVNDNAPVITSNGAGASAAINVAENSTAVTTVAATDADGSAPAYSIVGGADAALFLINASTGALRFVGAPDHENPADAGANNVYDVMVQVSDGSLTDSQAIAVTVTDLNDNAPVVTSNGAGASATLNVAENGTAVTTVTATDADGNALTYTITGGADAARFQIDSNTGVLTFVSAPDFESAQDAGADNTYDVTVQASDGLLTDTQAIAVTVTDVNDMAPVISSNGGGATASVSIAENGTAVTTVTATDADGSALTYSISGGADAALFQIDASTGVLRFVGAPNFENPTDAGADNVYDVTVRASDGSLTDTQAIAVTVTNVNDNAPVITSNGAGASAAINVAENTTAVGTVTASDADGNTLTYSISGGADAALFQIDAATGVLSFIGAPNFESPTDAGGNNVYNLTVRASDGTLADTQNLAVTVTDANDNAPVITSNGGGATANVSIAENGAAVTTVAATDADGPALTFSIVGGADAALFQIDAGTGVLSFVSAPNFESPTDAGANNIYDVTVRASDGTLTDTQAIAVTVTNLNDNAPVITSNGAGASAAINVAENGTVVGTVTATNADGNTLTYSISGGADAALFQIDASTGVLSFQVAPDYEGPQDAGGDNVYDVQVRVSDGSAADTQKLAVTVTDANDNQPVITSNGGSATASVSIAENSTAVTTVTATDADGPTLAYSIVGGADAALFQIDSATGALRFIAAPDYENPTDVGGNHVYDVTVQVSDGNATDAQAIAVTVTNLNDNAPVVTNNGGGATASVNVNENASIVAFMTATDADGSALSYSIVGGSDAAQFTVNASTGAVRFVATRDFENPQDAGADNVYDVLLQVSDGNFSDTQALAVTVVDLNDIAPVIASDGGGPAASLSMAESGTAVTTVVATDVDGPSIIYSIVGGTDAALFQIDANTGALSFMAAPDFENPQDAGGNNVYSLTVQASDGLLSDTQAITVTVTNADDNAPAIISNGGGASATVTLAENGTAVTNVAATDVDGSVLAYSIVGGADAALFQINATTGALSFQAAPDFENPQDAGADNVYDVTVQASDGSATDTQAIAVTVTNLNDTAPVITSNGGGATAGISVAENGTAVTTVAATDVDGPALSYSIVGGSDAALFQIDTTTGVLAFVGAPDFENPTDAGGTGVYDVTVQVSDGLLADTQAIAVTVTNANDNTPVISSHGGGATGSVNVVENAVSVTVVTASDADGSALIYSIAGGADAARFTVDASTGAVQFLLAVDFENPQDADADNVYDVLLQVSDGTFTDTQALAVTVVDVNDTTPVITSNGGGATASVSMAENGTAVTTVAAADADGPPLTFSIVGGADAALFQIDAATGVLRFQAPPDFENPQDAAGINVYDVTVQASDGLLADTQTIAVTVTNASDSPPVITSDGGGASAALNTAENGTAVTTVAATDPDGTAPLFSIVGGADAALFQIDAATGVLRFLAAPDFETPLDGGADNVYDVIVRASDGVLGTNQAIAVTVTDGADAPTLSNALPDRNATEDQAFNFQFSANTFADADAGDTLTYTAQLAGGGAMPAWLSFDSATRTFSGTPANADVGTFSIQVTADDGHGGTVSDSFTLTVSNTNDAPTLANAIPDSNATEDAAFSFQFAANTFADVDAGATLTYSARLAGGAGLPAWLLFDAATRTFSGTPLNADVGALSVEVVASDGQGGRVAASFTLTVANVNDAPVITSNGGGASGAVTVLENTTTVTTVVAADVDGPALAYSIVGGLDAALFTVDANTGVLAFVSAPDYENPRDAGADNLYEVTVQASDGSLVATQALTVTVADGDEFALGPLSDVDAAIDAVDENATTGARVGVTLRAVDADGSNNTVAYQLVNDASGRFTVDAATGVVTVADGSLLDYEAATSHTITALASSSDGSTRALTLTIQLRDVNETGISPIRDVDAGANAVAENATSGSTVGVTAQAVDPDAGASVAYSLLDDAGGRFAIDAVTGVITVADGSRLDYEAAASHTVRVQALSTDGSTTDLRFTIDLNDVDEFDITPGADADLQANTIAENAASGSTVGITAFARDLDGTSNGITYTLRDDAGGRFAIDPVSGVVTVADGSRLDFEDAAGHRIEVLATSQDGSTSTAVFTIALQAVNEHAPVITSFGGGDRAALQVASGQALLGTVTATDADQPSQMLVYAVDGGADAGRFTIDAATGLLQFAVAPQAQSPGDADGDNIYQVVVAVSDGQQSDRIALDVRVLQPAQVMPPDFVGGNGDTMVLGEAGRPQVATVQATDPANLPLVYTIVGGADAAHFTIDARTGALAFTVTPRFDAPGDADRDNAYEVLIQADNGSATRTKGLTVVMPSLDLPTVPVAVMPTPAAAGPLSPAIGGGLADARSDDMATGSDGAVAGTGTGSAEEGADGVGSRADVLGTGPGALLAGGYAPDVSAHLRAGTSGVAGRMLALDTVSWQGERDAGEPMALDIMSLLTLDSNFTPGTLTGESSGEGRGRITALPVATTSRADTGLSGIEVDATAVGTVAVTFGVVVWASRTGVLLASLLASTPAWQNFDPLPVLRRSARRRAQESRLPAPPQDDDLDSLVPDSQPATQRDPDDLDERMARHDPKANP